MTTEDPIEQYHRRAERIRTEMGGTDALARLRGRGERTVRQHIDALLDEASFSELGTFAHSARLEDRDHTPGDGKIGGFGRIDGRPVAVGGDDITVKRGSTALVGSRKIDRLLRLAIDRGHPFVYFGLTGGARVPDIMSAEGFAELSSMMELAQRNHRVPVATAIVGQSFGASSFTAAMSDLVVQVRGSCLAVTSPRVVEVATGERISFDELGGADVHATRTGQIDLAVDSNDEAYAAIRRFLSYLPSNAWTPAPRAPQERRGTIDHDDELPAMVPAKRSRAYDMRKVLARLADPDSLFEIRPGMGRGLWAGFARIDGWPVALMASNPMFNAGTLDPAACEKGIRLAVLCDSFNIPIVFLQDVPGFLVGRQVEHSRLLYRAIRFYEALLLCSAPVISIVVRKAFGLAWQALGGLPGMVDGLYAWPGAEIGFMDPAVGVNVLYGDRLSAEQQAERAAEMAAVTNPYGAAGVMQLDEVIDPAATRAVLARDLALLANRQPPPLGERPLRWWPTC